MPFHHLKCCIIISQIILRYHNLFYSSLVCGLIFFYSHRKFYKWNKPLPKVIYLGISQRKPVFSGFSSLRENNSREKGFTVACGLRSLCLPSNGALFLVSYIVMQSIMGGHAVEQRSSVQWRMRGQERERSESKTRIHPRWNTASILLIPKLSFQLWFQQWLNPRINISIISI